MRVLSFLMIIFQRGWLQVLEKDFWVVEDFLPPRSGRTNLQLQIFQSLWSKKREAGQGLRGLESESLKVSQADWQVKVLSARSLRTGSRSVQVCQLR